MMEMIAAYADQGFNYALIIYLLWERQTLSKGLKTTVEKIALLIEERIPKQ